MAKRVRTKNTATTFSVRPPVLSLDVWIAEQYRKYPSLNKRVAKRLKEMDGEQRAYGMAQAKYAKRKKR